jgi:hypothetical protein
MNLPKRLLLLFRVVLALPNASMTGFAKANKVMHYLIQLNLIIVNSYFCNAPINALFCKLSYTY